MNLQDTEARELISIVRKLADHLEARLGQPAASASADHGSEVAPFNGRTTLTPMVGGLDDEVSAKRRILKDLILFGRVYAINYDEGRGVTREERREIALAASYKGSQGVNGWFRFSGDGGPALENDGRGEMWLTPQGHKWMSANLRRFTELQLPDRLVVFTDRRMAVEA